ncbi:MAG: hypothetical protein R3232_09100, partial [Clostridia bacterium]|nr:hypothetical protein [Clostridia bacterium]
MSEIKKNLIKKNRLKGWNTWNVRSMLSHVLMPHGFEINIGIKEYAEGGFLSEALLGRKSGSNFAQRMHDGIEEVLPGSHSYSGDYSQVTVKWKGIEINVESASQDDDIFIKVDTLANQKSAAVIVASP